MAKALTKSQIAAEIATKSNITKKAAAEILEIIAQLAYKNAKNTFTLPGLGKLVLVNRKARVGRNPATGETIQKNDFRTGMTVLGQLVTVAPDDAASWLRLSRTVLQIRPRDDRERALLLDRASTATYIAYSRAGDRNLEADSLAVLGKTFADRKLWRPALDSMRPVG